MAGTPRRDFRLKNSRGHGNSINMDELQWDEVSNGDLETLGAVLLSSSTSRRVRVLQEIRDRNDIILPQDAQEPLIDLLFQTYPLYIDRSSRLAAQQCLRTVLSSRFRTQNLNYVLKRLRHESSKSSLAASSSFVLIEWCSVLLQILHNEPYDLVQIILGVISVNAKLLETCLGGTTRHTVKENALRTTRRALRAAFSSQSWGEDVIRNSVTRLTAESASNQKNAPFLGVIAGVCARLRTREPVMEDVKAKFLTFYTKEILGSRTLVPKHIATGLSDFFSSFVYYEDLRKEVLPVLEKAILRSPEVVLDGLIPSLVTSLRDEIDLSEMTYSHLLKPLMSNLKSTNPVVRHGAIQSIEYSITRCKSEDWLFKMAGEILAPIKTLKITNPEQRALHGQLLFSIPCSAKISREITLGLTPLLSRESSEIALEPEIKAFCKHLAHLVKFEDILADDVIRVISNGCGDKRTPFRKAWQRHIGDVLWNTDIEALLSSSNQPFTAQAIQTSKGLFDEIVANPLPAAQSGLVSIAYAFIALCGRLSEARGSDNIPACDWDYIVSHSMSLAPKPSFLLSPRIYTKVTSQVDLLWEIRALAATATNPSLNMFDSIVRDAWGQAFIYVIAGSGLTPQTRQQVAHMLSAVYLKNTDVIGTVMVNALWIWIMSSENSEKDSAAIAAGSNSKRFLHLVVKAICPHAPELLKPNHAATELTIKSQLIEMLVLCRTELIPNVSWIDLCLRTGIDPGKLICEHPHDSIRQLTRVMEDPIQSKIPSASAAICGAATDLAFVAPEVMVPFLVNLIQDDLDARRISKFTPADAAIARTPEGSAFIDVLSTKAQQVIPDRNTRDYDTLKWEEELRAQIAHKKGQTQKKMTPDEQAKVNAQIAKEQKIRNDVRFEEKRIRRGAGIIHGLATSHPIDASGWINSSIKSLLSLARANAALFVGDAVAMAYISCAEKVTSRLGALRPFIGIATLRAVGKTSLSPEMEAEPLGDLVTRIVYRLRFASEQRPFDAVTLAYVLPLIFLVLSGNGIDEPEGEEKGEQVLLSLEFLSFHSVSFMDNRLPRAEAFQHLISSLQRYSQHYKMIKDTLFDLCRCVASNIDQDELVLLLQGTIVPDISVRTAILQVIESTIDLTDLDFSEHIWLCCHDHVEENVDLAESIWEGNALEVGEDSYNAIMKYLNSEDAQLRGAAARALAHAVDLNPQIFSNVLLELQSRYKVEIQPKVAEMDMYGMPRKVDMTDHWEARSGIALAFKAMTNGFEGDQIVSFMTFLIKDGPLVDRNSSVRRQMSDSGRSVIAIRGQQKVEELMKLFEKTLETSDKATESSDWLNEAVIILYGSLARHLKAGDPRLTKVIQKLLGTLPTPSEMVQSAVAECLPPLIRLSGLSETASYIQEMLNQLLQSKSYASRRGAAYGLAGIALGKGVSVLRQHRIMALLKEATENKKDPNQRQGAVLAYELFSAVLGRVFEPYVIQIVPQLLTSFGDPNIDVREACLDAAKACFASLSSYGVKQILPTLLEGLDDTQWRSKKGACDLLGAMAYLDPQQLAASLPDIIPPLTVVLNDSHKEVRGAANRSLQRFGDVISNPEVKGLVQVLLKALSDPTKYTDDALDALIKVSFVHYLDAPSLALVVRILERGLGDRSTTKKKAAQIIGSLAHLTERKDLISHLPILVAGLRLAIVDPVPTTRATASKALGSLTEKLGEDALPDLIPSLMSTLKSDTGAGDRLGSAQALSEVLAGLGTTRLEETLPTILQNVSSSKPSAREGFMSLFIFLPACFGNSFASYLNRIIPPILAGLADDTESIRDTSLRAGRLLVKNFSTKAIDLLLPELEHGLADDSHRIRLSSVELVGDLLFNLTGITNKLDTEEQEEGATQAGQSLLEILGEEKRNKILASLYICRCDTSGLVRSAAISVWKALVASPRTLKDLVPTLSRLIIRRLGSSNMEQKVIAGNALGDLIKKAGESVLATLLPSLEDGLRTSPDVDAKQGICIALRELIISTSIDALEDYENTLVSTIRVALVDNDGDVREAAAEAFDAFQQSLGKKAVDQVLPHLLSLLRNDQDAEQALSALLTLLNEPTRANIILPNLIPTLLTPPISAFNAKALASLSEVASSAMTHRLSSILNALMDEIISAKDADHRLELSVAFDTVVISVDEFDGLNVVMDVMLTFMKHDDHRKRSETAVRMANFFSHAEIDFSRYHQDLIRMLLISFDDGDRDVVKAAWTALSQLTAHIRKEEMELLAISTRQVLRQVGVSGADLPGFSLPKGITAIFPIFLQGLLNGSVEQRTQSALGIADIIDRTGAESLKLFVTQITGPLIRVMSERSVEIKCAVFFALNKLLEKIPLAIKPFLPQLQRTFARGLADSTSETLRNRAAKGLGILITLTPRVDPLIAELISGSKTPDEGVRNAMMKALHEVVGKAGVNMSEASRNSVLGLIDDENSDKTDNMAITNARLLGVLVKNLPAATAVPVVRNRVLTTRFTHASTLGLNALLLDSPLSLFENFATETPSIICQGISHNDTFISDNSILAAGKYLLVESDGRSFDTNKSIFEVLAPMVQPGNPADTRRLALVVIRTVSRLHPELTRPHLALLAPHIFACVRDIVIPVKLAAEAAFLALFSVVDSEAAVFEKYVAGVGAELPPGTKRNMSDYFKRVALRLGDQARERREAEGGQGGLGLSNDELEDEKEVWSVGKLDFGEESFGEE